jgi:hypothetical protein
MAKRKAAAKRELIDPKRGGTRFVRRAAVGTFKEVDAQGRSIAQDRNQAAKTRSRKGQGDRGDRKTS